MIIRRLSDYIQLTKPRINFLVLLTTLVGYALAEPQTFLTGRLGWTLLGTALSVGSANAFNHFWERRIDALMKRTRQRPLPSGRLHPVEALIFGIFCGIAGVFLLWYFVNIFSAILALAAIFSYVPLYTMLKPITSLSTLVGTIPGAIPPVIGWVAVKGTIGFPALILFLIMFFWQPPHFLALALYLKDDYSRASLAMLPVEMDEDVSLRMMVLYTFFLLVVSLIPVATGFSGALYFYVAIVIGIIYWVLSLYGWVKNKGTDYNWTRGLFLFSVIHLPVLLGVFVWDRLIG